MDFAKLISDFAERHGIADLAAEDNAAALEAFVNLTETWRRLLADFRPVAKAAAGAGAFALDESSRGVSIARTISTMRLDVDLLSMLVEWLVDACHEWKGNIMAIAAVDDELERKRLEEQAVASGAERPTRMRSQDSKILIS